MKHIYRFGDKGYVQMDSYPENSEVRFGDVISNAIMVTMVIGIAAITAGAMVGFDITNPQRPFVHRTK